MFSKYRNKDWIRNYKFQFILSLCLITAPFLIYSHLFFDPIQTSFQLFGQSYELVNIPVQTFAWIVISSLTSTLIITILFFSVSDPWKYSLLIPFTIFLNHILINILDLSSIPIALKAIKNVSILVIVSLVLVIDYKVFKKYRQQVLNLKLQSLIREPSKWDLREINKKMKFLNTESDNNNSKMLYVLYNGKLYLEKLLKDSTWYSVSDIMRTNILRSTICAVIVVISTGLWFFHYYVPKGLTYFDLGFVTIGSHGYYDVQVFIWVISRKLMVIVPMVIWFLTYHSWWRYAILSPLILHLYQFWEAVQDGYSIVDAYGNYKVFPLVLLSVILLLALSRIVRRHSQSLDIYEQLTYEIEYLIHKLGAERSGVGDYRNRFEKIRNKLVKDSTSDSELTELTRLQQELQNKVIS